MAKELVLIPKLEYESILKNIQQKQTGGSSDKDDLVKQTTTVDNAPVTEHLVNDKVIPKTTTTTTTADLINENPPKHYVELPLSKMKFGAKRKGNEVMNANKRKWINYKI